MTRPARLLRALGPGLPLLLAAAGVGMAAFQFGWQVVQVYGKRPVGEAVALVCLTPARRCMTAEQVSGALALWPPNWRVSMAMGVVLLAGLLWRASR